MEVKQKQEYVIKFYDVMEKYQDRIMSLVPNGVRFSTRLLYRYLFGKDCFAYNVCMNDGKELYIPISGRMEDVEARNLSIIDLDSHQPILGKDTLNKLGVCCSTINGGFLLIDDDIIVELRLEDAASNKVIYGIVVFFNVDSDLAEINEYLKEVSKYVVFDESYTREKDNTFYLVVKQGAGYDLRKFEFNNFQSDIKKNYNDDIPYDKIVNILKSDRQELVIFSGEPGTGKTSLIKSLINEDRLDGVMFYYIEPSLFGFFTDASFVSFLANKQNSVIIMEDCEKLLMKRTQGNPIMNVMLNLTDGLIGEALKIKFLCTINCDETKIEPALLRKGRLSLKYRFEKLSIEKSKAILDCADRPMTLAELYNSDCDNGQWRKIRKKSDFCDDFLGLSKNCQ